MFAVATQFVMSQPNFSSMCYNLCRDIEKPITTLFIYVLLISVSQPLDPYRDIETFLQLEVCCNIGFFIATRLVH